MKTWYKIYEFLMPGTRTSNVEILNLLTKNGILPEEIKIINSPVASEIYYLASKEVDYKK